MELTKKRSLGSIWSTGLAIFAMFFGAGNIVFPLAIGQLTQDKNLFAVFGMILTGVFVPLAGVLAMLLFDGNYNEFFKRIGKIPGFLMILMILGLIGPFAGIPRCITISHATLNQFGLPLGLTFFSLLSCILIFLFTFRPNKIISLLGNVLTPLLLTSLGLIIVKGFFSPSAMGVCSMTAWQTFAHGVVGGYNTMDLLAAFFFSSVVLVCLRRKETELGNKRNLLPIAMFGSLFAALLLAVFYMSFSTLAAHQGSFLQNYANHEILGVLAYKILGPYAGLIAGLAVAFACLTTEIALAVVIAEYLRKTIFKEKIRYEVALAITLIVSYAISTLHFEGISAFLGPILQIFYPALIVLTLVNILHKLFNFKPVKLFFYGTLLFTFLAYLISL